MVANRSTLHHRVNSRRNLPLQWTQSEPQALDYKQVFSEALDLCDAFSAPSGVDVKNIPACIKTMRIQNFYGCVRRTVGGTTYHSLQRRFDEESFRSDESGRTNHSKKWRGYKRGLNMPRPSTVAKIEEIAGAKFSHELHQPLWIAMDVTVPLANQTRALLRNVNEEIRELALLIYRKMHRKRELTDTDIFQWCDCLSSEAGLPALSVLTLLLRKANELGDQDAASTISWWLFPMLLILGQELHQRGIAYLLYPFYLEHILPLYTHWKLNESAGEMARMSMVLNLFAFVNKRRSCVETLSFKDRVRNMYQWLNFFWGEAPATAFEPMFRTSKTGPDQEYVSDRQQQRNSAWLTLIGIIATGRAPMVLHRDYLDIDLDFSVLAGHRRENLLAIAGQMLAK